MSHPRSYYSIIDFLDKDGARDTDSGIAGKISLRSFVRTCCLISVGFSCFSRELVLENNIYHGGCDIQGCYGMYVVIASVMVDAGVFLFLVFSSFLLAFALYLRCSTLSKSLVERKYVQ